MMAILSREKNLPVTVEEVQTFLRLSDTQDVSLLENLIRSAVEEVETFTGLLLQKCTSQLVCDLKSRKPEGLVQAQGAEIVIRIPHIPFLKMLSVKVGEQEMSKYRIQVSHQDVALCQMSVEEGRTLSLTYDAGFGGEILIPEALKLAVLEIVAFRYEHRGEGRGEVPGMTTFLRPYRILHL
ncbi:Phage head-tail connector protein [Candidatus Bealeia paramacronuclearis]|uniref:Phage head-tail connector protein n=1 Tax=Candidatus Bealeia paramacronuclearis TaxID=1921001 RepID=A0ABZ2C3D3_9PROT|nr:Phage head-tail connector protein [Candidatus Bealeia paramacronuclearis]